jgi:isochorismate hydrolase
LPNLKKEQDPSTEKELIKSVPGPLLRGKAGGRLKYVCGSWLRSVGVDTLVFCGIDTSICVESSLRDAFNIDYDVILISDATVSNNEKHYESTIEHVKECYGLVMSIDEFSKFLYSNRRPL